MLYSYLQENSNDAVKDQFIEVYNIIKMIRENKEDLIYKSAIPRLKQTKLRGLPAFKEVIKKLKDEPKIKFDESSKYLWLGCFKLVYNYNTHALNLNGIECITFEKEITFKQIKDLVKLDEFILDEKEPNLYTHDDAYIDGIYKYIIDEGLTEKDLIKLINKLFNVLC